MPFGALGCVHLWIKDAGNAPRPEFAGGTSKAIHTGTATNTVRALCLGGTDTTTEGDPGGARLGGERQGGW